MSTAQHTPGPWIVEPWAKSFMVQKPGPIGFAQYVRGPSGATKFFRSRATAQAEADRRNATIAKATGQEGRGT